MKKIILLAISLLPLLQACTKDSEDLSTIVTLPAEEPEEEEEPAAVEGGVSGLFANGTYDITTYGWESTATISEVGGGVYSVDDCLGNYYNAIGYSGYVYPCKIQVTEDGAISLYSTESSYLTDLEGTYDFETGSFSWTSSFYGYEYTVAYEYVEVDNYEGMFGGASTNKVLVTTYYPGTKTAYTTTATLSPKGSEGLYTISDLSAGVLPESWGDDYISEGQIHVSSTGEMKLKGTVANVSSFSGSYNVSTDRYRYSYSFYSGYCTVDISNYFTTGNNSITDSETGLKLTVSTDSKTWYGDKSDDLFETDTIQALDDGYYCIADIFGKHHEHTTGNYSNTPAVFFIDNDGNITLANKKYYNGISNFSGYYDEDEQSFSWIVSDGETTYTVKTYTEVKLVPGLFTTGTSLTTSVYGYTNTITITDNGDGTYELSDGLGGYYEASGWGRSEYPINVSIDSNGKMKMVSGSSYFTSFEGKYDSATGSLSWTTEFYGYTYTITATK